MHLQGRGENYPSPGQTSRDKILTTGMLADQNNPPGLSHPADRPVGKLLVIFDGDCGFCRRSVGWMKRVAGNRADYAPSQEVGSGFPSAEFGREVKLVEPGGHVYGGAEAVFRLVSVAGRRWWWSAPLWFYRRVPGARRTSEAAYRFVASHRRLFSVLTGGG